MRSLMIKTVAFLLTTGIAGIAASLMGLNPAVAGAVAAVVIFNSK